MSIEHELGFLKIRKIGFWIFYAAIPSHETMYYINTHYVRTWKASSLNDDFTNVEIDWEKKMQK